MSEKTEIDWGKMTELQNAANNYTEEKLKKALVFDPKKLTAKSKGFHEVYDKELGTIRYTYLTYTELNEVNEMRNPITKQPLTSIEKSVQILFKQLKTATPTLTIDEMTTIWDYGAVVRLLTKLQGEGSFFYRKPQATSQTSKAGSTSTSKPKTLG